MVSACVMSASVDMSRTGLRCIEEEEKTEQFRFYKKLLFYKHRHQAQKQSGRHQEEEEEDVPLSLLLSSFLQSPKYRAKP